MSWDDISEMIVHFIQIPYRDYFAILKFIWHYIETFDEPYKTDIFKVIIFIKQVLGDIYKIL